MPTDATTWTPATCPPWCAGQHAPTVALADDITGLVIHSRQLLDHSPEAAIAGLAVTLEQAELHPDSDEECANWPHLIVTPHREHDSLGITVAELRGWSVLLDLAADRATELLGGVS